MVGSVAQEMKGRWETNWGGFRDSQMTHKSKRHLEIFLQWDTMPPGEWMKSWLWHFLIQLCNLDIPIICSFSVREQVCNSKGFASSGLVSEICLSLVYCPQILSQIKSRLPIYSKKDDFSLNQSISEIVQINLVVLLSLSLWSSFYAYAEILFSLPLLNS